MPRAFCAKTIEKRAIAVRAFANAAIIRSGCSNKKDFSQKVGINYSTLVKRMSDNDDIQDMRLKELWAIVDAGKASDDELLAMLKRRLA